MNHETRQFLILGWRVLNAVLAVIFLYLIVDAWIEVFYYNNHDKQYYYFGTLFIIPLITCLIVVFGWSLEDK